jgi:protocatechuate 3,4-dioxygenase beta subunit
MKAGISIILLGLLPALCWPAGHVQMVTFSGRVIDYQARPVSGAEVICYGTGNLLSSREYEIRGRTETMSDGRFALEVKKEQSTPLLVAGKPGLALGWAQISSFDELVPTIRLGRPGFFKGTILDTAGSPLPGALVRICLTNKMMMNSYISPLVPESWFTSKTDAEGQFVFDKVPAGATADFHVEAPGMASKWTFCDFGLDEGEQFIAGSGDIRIVLVPEARINGRVIDEKTDKPVGGVQIRILSSNSVVGRYKPEPVKTDPEGRFEIAGLAGGEYLLRLEADKEGFGCLPVTVEPGQRLSGVKIIRNKGIAFEVFVYNPNDEAPVENARVNIWQQETAAGCTMFKQTLHSDSNGLTQFRVPKGECEIEVVKLGYGTTSFSRQDMKIDTGQLQRKEIPLDRSAYILSGVVVDEQGRTLSGASVMQWGFGPRALTDSNGKFDTSNIYMFTSRLPSSVRVLARHVPSGLGAIGKLEDPSRSGELHGQLVLKPAYTFTGKVVNPAGRSIPSAYVKLLQAGGGSGQITGAHSKMVTEVTTDTDGVYCIRSIPHPGDSSSDVCVIAAYAEGFGPTIFSGISFDDAVDRTVQLKPIVLRPADRAIAGVVVDSNEQAVAGALVRAYGPKLDGGFDSPVYGKTLTDAQGRFRITGLCNKSVTVHAISPWGQKHRGTTLAHAGNENVRIVLRRVLQFGESLAGKALPELKDLNVDFSPADAADKMILLCFFDMEQRPSRNCLRQLSAKAQELNARDVVIAAVQISKVDENTLAEWLKDNDMPFPVGMNDGDQQQARFAWGVKSLPWLILTDKKHIVIAEGFAVGDLENKLKKESD